TFCTCFFTVSILMSSERPISRLEKPRATCLTTWTSRLAQPCGASGLAASDPSGRRPELCFRTVEKSEKSGRTFLPFQAARIDFDGAYGRRRWTADSADCFNAKSHRRRGAKKAR